MKEVAKYQQTFHGTADDSVFTFGFYRIYKQQPKNKWRLRVVTVADYRDSNDDNVPHAYFAQDLTNGTSVYSDEIVAGDSGMKSNDFFLGVVMPVYFGGSGKTALSGQTQFAPPEVYLDEISTSPFTVKYRYVGTNNFGTTSIGFLVTFEITEIEM